MKIFLWGTGQVANDVLKRNNIFDKYEVLGFIDNDKNKIGAEFWGKEVYSPEIIKTQIPDKIVVLTAYYNEIREQIISMKPELCHDIESKEFFYKEAIFKRYGNTEDDEIKSVLKHIEDCGLSVFNYDFVNQYMQKEIEVFWDDVCEMYYVFHGGKRLYFAKYMNTEKIVRNYYRGLLIEQDEMSPHRYLAEDFDVNEGDVVIDAGAAEGNFSLDIVDKASKIYMFEVDERWLEALQQTFKDYSEKVVIVKKYITSVDEGLYATLDSIVREPVDFIKMDIEGNEWDALIGAEKLIGKSEHVKCSICAYHRDFDEILIKDVLGKYKMECTTTPGFMWFPYGAGDGISTRLNRGIVRGKK